MDVLLVIDVGNTNTSVGIFNQETLLHTWRIQTNTRMTSDEMGLTLSSLTGHAGISPAGVTGSVISCVVPPVLCAWSRAVSTYFSIDPLVVGPGVRTGIPIRYEDPREVGADRIANAIAVVHEYRPPAIIVDLGTATTLSVIDEQGQYLGGSISPGVKTAADALSAGAARLPQVELKWPEKLVQRSTVLGMQAGILYGAAAMVDGLIQRVKQEYAYPFVVVATGGLSTLLAGHIQSIDHVNPNLTLSGLRLIWLRNVRE